MKLIYFQQVKKNKLKKGKMHYLFLKYFKDILVAYILHLYADTHSIQTTANIDIYKESEQSIANY